MEKELDSVIFWYDKSEKCCDRSLGFGMKTITKLGNPKIWKQLQEIFEELNNGKD